MEIDYNEAHWNNGRCPQYRCKKPVCECGLLFVNIPATLGDDSSSSSMAPKNGAYCNAIVKYESNGHIYVYSAEGVPERLSSNGTLNFEELLNRPQYNGEVMTGGTNIPEVPSAVSQLTNDLDFQTEGEVNSTVASAVAGEAAARQQADNTLQSTINGVSNALGSETTARRNADNNLQSQIDGISASSDVKDIVGTKADLDNYDTSTLGDNDIIKVLQDETQNGSTTYYRWNTSTSAFTLIGAEGPYYTKSATDTLLNAKADKATTYTKTETDTLLNAKADKATTYTKTEVDTALNAKADKATTYTKIEVNTAVNGVDAKIGTLANLSTTDKSNLVAAINEVAEMENSTFFYYSLGTNSITLYTDIAKTIPASAEVLRDAYLKGPVYLIDGYVSGGSMPDFEAAPITYFWYGQGSSGVNFTVVLGERIFWHCYGYEGDTSFACRSYSVLNDSNIEQTTGTSTTDIMSQKAVTDALSALDITGTTEAYTIAAADWQAVANAAPYAYSATVTATYTIGANTLAELYNDNPVAFANYGFAIESINGQVLTIYAIEAPTASTTLKVNYKETA